MKSTLIKDEIVKAYTYYDNQDVEEVCFQNAFFVGPSAFAKSSIKDAKFGFDITRISHGAFADCKSLTDVWFAIIDANKIIEIADDAFRGCEQPITFHIFASALKHKYLNDYARRHGFRVVGMI